MFICQHCHKQSQPGESSVVVPTVIRPVLYEYQDGRSYMGAEWAKSGIVCETCAKSEYHIPLRSVKTVEVKTSYERPRVYHQEQYI